jgi:hypothetical protein
MPRRRNRFPSLIASLCLALIFLMVAAPARAQTAEQTATPTPQPLPLAQYRAELQSAIDQLDAAADDDTEIIQNLQQHFARITRIELPSGQQVVLIPNILAHLSAVAGEGITLGDEARTYSPKAIALLRLHGALAQIDSAPNDNTAARLAILAKILARPEFNNPMTLLDRLWQWLKNLLTQLLPQARPGANTGWLEFLFEAVPWIVSVIVLGLVLWLLSYWLQRLLRSFVTDARLQEFADEGDLPRSSAEARQQARTAAQSGLYRDAVRRLYLAAILQLAEHDLIPYERSLTNREVLTRIPTDSPIRTHLEPVVATFDQVWYGIREPDQATFDTYERQIDALAAVAAQAAATPEEQGAS